MVQNSVMQQRTIREILLEGSSRIRVFDRHGIDSSVKGFNLSLADACAASKIDADEVEQQLLDRRTHALCHHLSTRRKQTRINLVQHIRSTHHAYLSRELPWLRAALTGVRDDEGQMHSNLPEIEAVFLRFLAELNSHIMKEEFVLFPTIEAVSSSGDGTDLACGSISHALNRLRKDHRTLEEHLAVLWCITEGFEVPQNISLSHRNVLLDMKELHADTIAHFRLEEDELWMILG